MTSRRQLLTLLASSPVVWSGAARAQSTRASRAAGASPWPTQPLKILVGFPAGSTPDLAARSISESLSRQLGQPVVVENKPGASGNIAADLVAKATDHHTMGVMINGNLTVAKMLNPAVPFDPARAFTPLSLIGVAPLLMVVAGNASGNNPNDYLQWARNLGDKGNYGTPGNGTVGHLGMELVKSKTGITAVHVPFQGNPQVVNALLAGQLQMALLPPGLAAPHIKAGKLKAVGITSMGRSSLVPDMPTLRDADVRGAELEIWVAAVASANLPKPIAARLSAALVDAIRSAEVRQRLLNVGWQAVGTAPEGLANRMKADTAVLGGIIQMRGITAAS